MMKDEIIMVTGGLCCVIFQIMLWSEILNRQIYNSEYSGLAYYLVMGICSIISVIWVIYERCRKR